MLGSLYLGLGLFEKKSKQRPEVRQWALTWNFQGYWKKSCEISQVLIFDFWNALFQKKAKEAGEEGWRCLRKWNFQAAREGGIGLVIPEKIHTERVKDMEFPGVSKK